MREEIMRIDGYPLRIVRTGTVVVGAGAAGLNAANELWEQGYQQVVIVTEDIRCSTSRNAGSDKQTYYKLALCGGDTDSVEEMAETLFSGGCVDGDIALAEAANSVPAFLNLCRLGVPFPVNRYGEYAGYKTDHDPRRRGTSAGPLTSRQMTEVLEAAVRKKGIELLDGYLAVALLVRDGKVYGVLCVDTHAVKLESSFLGICCSNVIWATGGPAGIYADSAFPKGHSGMTGVLLEAGARGKNLTEWQYGLASVSPRWNVSGTYMQVLPRLVSTDAEGGDEREFLLEHYPSREAMMGAVFLKG